MDKYYPKRDDNYAGTYMEWNFCECSHDEENHQEKGWFGKSIGECKICKCPMYKLNEDNNGRYITCSREESEFSRYNMYNGLNFYKKVVKKLRVQFTKSTIQDPDTELELSTDELEKTKSFVVDNRRDFALLFPVQ